MTTLVELVNTSAEFAAGKVVLKPQAPMDTAKLNVLMPEDQVGTFRGYRDRTGNFIFELIQLPAGTSAAPAGLVGSNAPAAPGLLGTAPAALATGADGTQQQVLADSHPLIAGLIGKNTAQLQEIAAEYAVEWDGAASVETMIQRIAHAQAKATDPTP